MSEVRFDFVVGAKGATPEVKALAENAQKLEQRAKTVGLAFTDAFKKADAAQTKHGQTMRANMNIASQVGATMVKSLKQQDTELQKNTKSVESLQKQYRDLVKVLGTLDRGSAEFKKINDEAARVANKIGDIKKAIDAANPQAKFNGIIQVTSGIAGGFGAIQGALGLLGRGGDDVYKQMLRLQQVMAFSQGINDLFGLKDAFGNLARSIGITTIFQRAQRTATVQAAAATGAATLGIQANTTASKVAAIATGGLINALKALRVALLNNPFTAIAVVILAVVTALFAFADSSKAAEEAYAKLVGQIDASIASLKKMQELRAGLQEQADKKESAALKKQLEDMRAAGATEEQLLVKQNEIRAREQRNRVNALIAAGTATNQLIIEQENKIAQQRAAIESAILAGADDDKIKEFREDIIASYTELGNLNRQLLLQDAAVKAAIAEGAADDAKAKADELERERQANEQLIQEEKAFQQKMKELRRKVQQEQVNQLTGEDRIEAQRVLNRQLIQDQQDAFVAEQQEILNQRAKRLGLKKAETFLLTAEQKKLFDTLKEFADENAKRERETLQFEQASARVALIQKQGEREIEEARIAAGRKLAELKRQGIEEVEARQIVQKDIDAVVRKVFDDGVNAEIEKQKDVIRLRERGKESELVFEKRKALDLLQVDRETLSQRLALELIAAQFLPNGEEQQKRIRDLKIAIADITSTVNNAKKELKKAEAEDDEFSLAKIFGLTDDDAAEFNAQAAQFLNTAVSIGQQALAAEQAMIDERLRQNQEYMDSLDERLSELKSTLEEEKRLQEQGLANNVKATKSAIAQLNSEKQKSIENEKKLNEERKKIAKEQAILDAATVASGLIVSSVNIFKVATETAGPLGVIIGLAGAAALIAGFLTIKAKIAQATKLEKGGRIKGRRHSEGGEKFYSDRGEVQELEEGEWTINRQSSDRYNHVLAAINSKDRAKAEEAMLDHLLKGTSVVRSKKINKELIKQKTLAEKSTQKSTDLSFIEGKMESATNDIKAIRKELQSESITVLQDGTKVIKQGNTTRIIHPNGKGA